MKRCDNLLIGVNEIAEFLGVSQPMFYQLVELFGKSRCPLPAIKINGRWYAHKSNLDEHLLLLTRGNHEIELDRLPGLVADDEKHGS